MVIRIIIFLFIAGGVLIYMGVRDYMLISKTHPEPAEIDLPLLEKDPSLDNFHIIIGPHIALYTAAVFEYEYDELKNNDFTESSPVNYTYYPIISETHPFFDQLAELEAEYGSIDDIPDELWPLVDNFAVLIKTTEFETVGDIPDSWMHEETAQGIVINKIDSLDSEEKKLMNESFPLMDMNSVLILDKDRTVGNPLLHYLKLGGGFICILAAIGIIIRINKNENPGQNDDTQI